MKKVYLIAAFVAILAGFATYLFASSLAKSQTIQGAPKTPVVVAVVDIPENTKITPQMVQVVQVIEGTNAMNAVTVLDNAIGHLNMYPVVKGEQIISTKISPGVVGTDQANAALSYQLQKGEFAYTIAVSNVQGVSGFISKGDLVDIVYTYTEKGVITTKFLMRDIYVLRISNYAANYAANSTGGTPITSYVELVIKLNEQQVIDLTHAQEEGSIRLVLKPIVADTESTTAVK